MTWIFIYYVYGIWPVQFKLHIIQAHRLPLTFFELLEPNLVVLTKLKFGFLLCSDLWLSFLEVILTEMKWKQTKNLQFLISR